MSNPDASKGSEQDGCQKHPQQRKNQRKGEKKRRPRERKSKTKGKRGKRRFLVAPQLFLCQSGQLPNKPQASRQALICMADLASKFQYRKAETSWQSLKSPSKKESQKPNHLSSMYLPATVSSFQTPLHHQKRSGASRVCYRLLIAGNIKASSHISRFP